MSAKQSLPLSPSLKKQKWFKFRPINDDDEVIGVKIEKSGLSKSEYMRRMCRDGEIIVNEDPKLSLFDSQVVYELNKSGVNLMQFLKKFHSTGHPPPPNFTAAIDEHRALLEKVANLIEE